MKEGKQIHIICAGSMMIGRGCKCAQHSLIIAMYLVKKEMVLKSIVSTYFVVCVCTKYTFRLRVFTVICDGYRWFLLILLVCFSKYVSTISVPTKKLE